MDFVNEEQAALSKTIYTQDATDDFLKPADRAALSPWEQYQLTGLLRYRDDIARRLARPPYQVMGEDLVRELAAGDCTAADSLTDRRVHPRYRNPRAVAALAEIIHRLRTEADARGLSKKRPPRPRPTPAQQAARSEAAYHREHLFVPIREALRNRFGLYATQLLLSDRLITDLLTGATSLRNLPPYRQALFVQAAAELGLDLGEYATKPGEEKG